MLSYILALLGYSREIRETKRFYGVRYQRIVTRLFGVAVRDRWRKVGWADGSEEQMFPANKD